MSFVVRRLDHFLSIGVDHLPNLDRFGGELLPFVEREEIEIASGEQILLAAELFVSRLAAISDSSGSSLDSVSSQLASRVWARRTG